MRACVVTTIFIEIFAVEAQRDEFHSICQMNADIHVNVIQYLCVEIVVSQTKDKCRETKRNRNKTKTNSLIENYFFSVHARCIKNIPKFNTRATCPCEIVSIIMTIRPPTARPTDQLTKQNWKLVIHVHLRQHKLNSKMCCWLHQIRNAASCCCWVDFGRFFCSSSFICSCILLDNIWVFVRCDWFRDFIVRLCACAATTSE